MRTTLEIDDDVLSASKELAKAADTTAGKIISDLVRKALTQADYAAAADLSQSAKGFTSVPLRTQIVGDIESLPHRGGIVTTEMVRQLMDEEGI